MGGYKHPFALYVSRDDIRLSLLKENDEYFSKEKEVFDIFTSQIAKCLLDDMNVVADATHLTLSSRRKLLTTIKEKIGGTEIQVNAIIVQSDLKECLKRNNFRVGRKKVPEKTIRNMHNSFTYPSLEEGFDKIYLFDNDKPLGEAKAVLWLST